METHTLSLVKKSFSQYLSHPCWRWNWVAHQTFDLDKCGYTKKNGDRDFHRLICQESYERFTREIRNTAMLHYGFAFAELHQNGFPHWHAVLHVEENLLGQPRRRSIFEYMHRQYGRSRIEPINRSDCGEYGTATGTVADGIARYLTKYVAKESQSDNAWWDFSGAISGFEADPSRIRAIVGIPRPVEH